MASNQNWIKYSNLGFQVIATLFLFGGTGYYLDSKYNYDSLFLIIGLLLGCAVSMYGLWASIFK
jgi:F0F1-type ATP synthase assembly protein I